MNLIRSAGRSFLPALLLGSVVWCSSVFGASSNASSNSNKNKSPVAPVPTTYSGQAVALDIEGVQEPVAGPIVIADTGPLPSGGGSLVADETAYRLFGADGVTVALGVDFAHAATYDSGAATNTDSSLSGFQVLFDTSDGERVAITADYVGASAVASLAHDGKAGAEGSISISNLRVNGVPVTVTGAPNQVVDFPEVHMVFNDQQVVTSSHQAEIKLTAMRIDICHCIVGAYGVVSAGITGGSTPPPQDHDCGKLTGGGWIVGPSGAKATFAVSGGIRRGEFWGDLNYNDHGAGLRVKSTRVTNFVTDPTDADCRIISYDVMINGLAGTAEVKACDRGEPGRDDFFSLTLSTGYSAQGTLGGDGSGGGNIQLHKCPPGWDK
ncbi:MAG: hypothetical protein JWQ83_463 [Lacunisphaera sp.]|nr:hypothetical protein [Lacunisphaera sp.]